MVLKTVLDLPQWLNRLEQEVTFPQKRKPESLVCFLQNVTDVVEYEWVLAKCSAVKDVSVSTEEHLDSVVLPNLLFVHVANS